MASYHFSAQIIGRGKGRSAIAAAAYRSGARLVDRASGQIYDYTRKRGIVHTEILLPASAPKWMADRERLWNHAQSRETRKDSQLAREINLALPHELTDGERLDLLRTFVTTQFVAKGMVADIAVHAPVPERGDDPRNHHAHIMLTLRQAGSEGLFKTKTRSWNARDELQAWRESWGQQQNRVLAEARHTDRVDHRSLEAQRAEALEQRDIPRARALDRLPEIHIGPQAMTLHEVGKLPRVLRPLLPPPPAPMPVPPSIVPPPREPSAARENHAAQTRHLAPIGERRTIARPPPVANLIRQIIVRPPFTPVERLRPKHRPPRPKPFLRDTWRLDIVRREREQDRRPPRPLFQLTITETKVRRAWRDRVSPRERLTRLEFNLKRLEQNRVRQSKWTLHTRLRRARMLNRWAQWAPKMRWLMARTQDFAQFTRLAARLASDYRILQALTKAVMQAAAHEARVLRRLYAVRLKVQREFLRSRDQQRRRARHRSASDRKDH